MFAVIVERRALADAVFAGDQKHRAVIDQRDRYDDVALIGSNAPDANRIPSLIAQLLFVETQAHSFLGNEHDLVIAVGELGVDQAIVFFNLDSDDAAFPHIRVIGQIGFLNDAGARRENDVQVFVPGFIDNVRAHA